MLLRNVLAYLAIGITATFAMVSTEQRLSVRNVDDRRDLFSALCARLSQSPRLYEYVDTITVSYDSYLLCRLHQATNARDVEITDFHLPDEADYTDSEKVLSGMKSLYEILKANNARTIHIEDRFGFTLLHLAVLNNQRDLVEMWSERDTLYATTAYQHTALDLALLYATVLKRVPIDFVMRETLQEHHQHHELDAFSFMRPYVPKEASAELIDGLKQSALTLLRKTTEVNDELTYGLQVYKTTRLHLAVYLDSPELVDLILTRRGSLAFKDAHDEHMRNILNDAISLHYVNLVDFMLSKRYDRNYLRHLLAGDRRASCVGFALRYGHMDLAERLILLAAPWSIREEMQFSLSRFNQMFHVVEYLWTKKTKPAKNAIRLLPEDIKQHVTKTLKQVVEDADIEQEEDKKRHDLAVQILEFMVSVTPSERSDSSPSPAPPTTQQQQQPSTLGRWCLHRLCTGPRAQGSSSG